MMMMTLCGHTFRAAFSSEVAAWRLCFHFCKVNRKHFSRQNAYCDRINYAFREEEEGIFFLSSSILIVHFQKLMLMHLFCVIVCNFVFCRLFPGKQDGNFPLLLLQIDHLQKFSKLARARARIDSSSTKPNSRPICHSRTTFFAAMPVWFSSIQGLCIFSCQCIFAKLLFKKTKKMRKWKDITTVIGWGRKVCH